MQKLVERLSGIPGGVVQSVRSCPVCGDRRGRVVWREAGKRYVRCLTCGVTFADIRAEEYERERHNVWDLEKPDEAAERFYGGARTSAHDRFLDLLGPAAGRSMLDVGCGLGYLLERAQGRGWSVNGCDTSSAWVNIANGRLGEDRVRLGTVGQLDASQHHDVVCAWDVLEHIFEPVPFLGEIARRVAPGGVVFLRTPNLTYLRPVYTLRRLVGHASAELGPTNHVVYFTAPTLRAAFRRAGLRAVGFPVLPPPAVEVLEWRGSRLGRTSVQAKRAWSDLAGRLAAGTRGRVVIGSDLDVFARPEAATG